MLGRDTPSPGLERAAAYVVGEFRRLGLQPAGEHGTYVQRFGVSRWTVDTARLVAGAGRRRSAGGGGVRQRGAGDRRRRLRGSRSAAARSSWPARSPPRVTASPGLRGRIVILAPDFERPLPFDLGDRVDEIAAVARAVILLSNRDSSAFTRRIDASLEPRLTPDFRDGEGGAPVVELARARSARWRRPPGSTCPASARWTRPWCASCRGSGWTCGSCATISSGRRRLISRRCSRAGTTGCGASTW